jgi:hypothetical protein
MRRNRAWACLAVVAALGIVACGDEAERVEEEARDTATTVVSGLENATRLKATLTGAAEVPGPGDPDGSGTATVNIDVSKGDVCYEVNVQRIDRPTGMHIHEADSGKAGDIVVNMTTPTASDTTTTGCAQADAALLGRLVARPNGFYVNVHSQTYPQGAVRGQLTQ